MTFACSECGKTFLRSSTLTQHLLVHAREESLRCDLCGLSCGSERSLQRHAKRHLKAPAAVEHPKAAEAQNQFSCGECGQRFPARGALLRHLLVHIPRVKTEAPEELEDLIAVEAPDEAQEQVICGECGQKFPSEDALSRHLPVHVLRVKTEASDAVEAPEQFSCSECGQTFPARDALLRHLPVHILRFKTEAPEAVEDPVKVEVLEVPVETQEQFSCGECGQTFPARGALLRHLQAHIHREEAPFSCGECGARFPERERLELHLRDHLDQDRDRAADQSVPVPTSACQHCGQQYKYLSCLASHVRKMHTPGQESVKKEVVSPLRERNRSPQRVLPFPCSQCDRSFRLSVELQQHAARWHASDARPYPCGLCGKVFINSGALRTHSRAQHAAEKPHRCAHCGRCFGRESYLRLHQHVHVQEMPYRCNICGAGHKHIVGLWRHLYRLHLSSPVAPRQGPEARSRAARRWRRL